MDTKTIIIGLLVALSLLVVGIILSQEELFAVYYQQMAAIE